MVRARILALPHQTGSARHSTASKPRLDPARIATLSGTLALNLLALGLLMMPLALPIPMIEPTQEPGMVVREIPPEIIVPVEIVKQKPPVTPPRPVAPPAATQPREVPVAIDPVANETGSAQAVDTGPVDTDPVDAGPADSGPAGNAPTTIQLQYRHAPAPDYPRNAQRRGWTGSVLLQVLVGVDGRPLEVSIARSSGHRELDEAARAQVLKRWRFQPAMQGSRPVQALGLVPIEFTLPR